MQVQKGAQCAAQLRQSCKPDSVQQRGALNYGIVRGGGGGGGHDTQQLTAEKCVATGSARASQRWAQPHGNGGPLVHVASGKCVTVGPGALYDLELKPCQPGGAQNFTFQGPMGAVTGTYAQGAHGKVESSTAGCWDLQYYDVAAGAKLGLYTCGAKAPNGEPATQQWESFGMQHDGTITTPAGLCITAPATQPPAPPSDPYAGVVDLHEHLASFLLMRGPYAWIGYAWVGCSQPYVRPKALDTDYGTPTGFCKESSPGVFEREYTKASIKMDCGAWQGSITMK